MRRGFAHLVNHAFSAAKTRHISLSPALRTSLKFSVRFVCQTAELSSKFHHVSKMVSVHDKLSANGVNEPLALPGGAPLKVKNSLSKEKVPYRTLVVIDLRKHLALPKQASLNGILADQVRSHIIVF
jgi:hypothetical protein